MRKLAIILALFLLLLFSGIVSAETVQVGNYTISFDMNRPYVVENASFLKEYDFRIVETAIGNFYLSSSGYIGDKPTYIGYLKTKDGSSAGFYFREDTLNYAIAIKDDLCIYSTMNLSDTVDFVRSLDIKPRKP